MTTDTTDLITETKLLKLKLPEDGLKLEHGGVLPEIQVAYEACGTLSPNKDNVIFICHALTGDAHVAGRHIEDTDRYTKDTPWGKEGDFKGTGWWSNMVRPGGGIDTDHFHVVCANILGGCKGTTGPSSINPETGKPYGSRFPEITVRDIVTVHKRFLEQLGFINIYAVLGGSFGGMQAVEFSVQFPGFAERCISIASGAFLTTQALAFDLVGRSAILSDPNWKGGDYYDSTPPTVGLGQARKLAHITYLSEKIMAERFGRRRQTPNTPAEETPEDASPQFEVESYLNHQGRKFTDRFDANSYLHITRAMDEYNLKGDFKSTKASVARSQSRTLIVALSGDWLFLPSQARKLSKAFFAAKKDISYFCLSAPAGHDAFLIHIDELTVVLANFLTRTPSPPSSNLPEEKSSDYDSLIDMMPGALTSVLDLACNDGALLAKIAKRHPTIACTGADINCGVLTHVLKAGHNAILADIDTDLGIIPDNAFDCAVLSESIQVVKEPAKVFDELLRIAPVALVSFPNFGNWRVRLSLLFKGRMPITKRLPYKWYDTPNIHLCTLMDFTDLCDAKKIKIEKIKYLASLKTSRLLTRLGFHNLGASRVLVKISRPEKKNAPPS